jgi:PucR family transcriptional regulator, purine catabolism regulatory protein
MKKESSLIVEEVLKRPLFQHAEVIAGRQGLRRAIRWVHILESPRRGSFLNGGELVLSTGVGFGQDPEKRLAYLHELIHHKTAGLCIELGEYIVSVTPDMIELADHHQFPLIVFHRPVRFVDITLDLHELLVNIHTQTLRTLGNYAQTIQRLTLEAHSVTRILKHFQNLVHSQTFYLPTEGKALFTPTMPQSVQTEIRELLHASLSTSVSEEQGQRVFSISDRKQVLCQPVTTMGYVMAHLGIILFEREVDEFLTLTLDYTTTAIAQCLMRKMNLREQTYDQQNQLLDDLLENKPRAEEEVRDLLHIKSLGTQPPLYQAAIIEVICKHPHLEEEANASIHDLLSLFRSVFSPQGFQTYHRSRGQRVYLLLADLLSPTDRRGRLQKAMAGIERLIRQSFGSGAKIRYGVSRPSRQYANAFCYFQEAEQTLHVQESPFFEDLGLQRLLLQIKEEHVNHAFIEDYLGTLLEHDRENGTTFLFTLRTFLDHYDSKQEAADRLYISRQTLYQRLEKIRELIGDDFLSSPEKRLCLNVALRFYEWAQKKT